MSPSRTSCRSRVISVYFSSAVVMVCSTTVCERGGKRRGESIDYTRTAELLNALANDSKNGQLPLRLHGLTYTRYKSKSRNKLNKVWDAVGLSRVVGSRFLEWSIVNLHSVLALRPFL